MCRAVAVLSQRLLFQGRALLPHKQRERHRRRRPACSRRQCKTERCVAAGSGPGFGGEDGVDCRAIGTVAASGPTQSSRSRERSTPSRGTRALVGLKPARPVSAAGMRTEPPVSVPSAPTAMPSVTETAAPDEEPPGKRRVARYRGRQAFRRRDSAEPRESKCRHIGTADNDCAGRLQARDDGRICLSRLRIFEKLRTAARWFAREVDIVFDRDRQSGQRRDDVILWRENRPESALRCAPHLPATPEMSGCLRRPDPARARAETRLDKLRAGNFPRFELGVHRQQRWNRHHHVSKLPRCGAPVRPASIRVSCTATPWRGSSRG